MHTKTIAIIFCLLVFCSSAFGAVFPLEITNIKPAGTGTPAIPSTNRIFRAYPGIEYNIRAAVIGGLYPYTYSLSGQPSGMTINSATGEISWPNPASNSGTITLSVTDSEANTTSATWAITVTSSTSDFIFVNGAYSGTETGSITQPYSSLANMLSSQTDNNKIVYFRAGTYQMVDYNSGADYVMNLGASPRNFIACPGESVTLQGGSANSSQAHRIVMFDTFYFDGLTINDTNGYAILTYGSNHYMTVRNCVFDGVIPTDGENENYGFIFTSDGGFHGQYYVVQDNEFRNWRNASAIGSMYYQDKALIENNYVHSPAASGSGSIVTQGISPKYGTDYLTVRGNKVIMNYGALMGDQNGAFIGSDHVEVCFNLFVMTSGRGGHIFDHGMQGQLATHYWRNTLIGDLGIRQEGGPYYINNNVIVNQNNVTGWDDWTGSVTAYNYIYYSGTTTITNYATLANNLTSTTASTLVDSANDYKLVAGQSAYIGTRGWQLADGSTPMEGTYEPSPVNGACGSNDGATLSSLTSGNANNCLTGTVANFTGSGPWTWDCAGSGGGTADTGCTAYLQSVVTGGIKTGIGSTRFGVGSAKIIPVQ